MIVVESMIGSDCNPLSLFEKSTQQHGLWSRELNCIFTIGDLLFLVLHIVCLICICICICIFIAVSNRILI